MDTQKNVQALQQLQHTLHMQQHAMGVLSYDGATIAPLRSAEGRGETMGYLGGLYFNTLVSDRTRDLTESILSDREHVSAIDYRAAELLKEAYDETVRIPEQEYVAYQKLQSDADAVWHEAKSKNDFAMFAPYLKQMFEYNARFAGYKAPGSDAYDTLLDGHEKGLSRAVLDPFFAMLRSKLTPVILAVGEKEPPRTDFLHRSYPVWQQQAFSNRLMEIMGLDRTRCSIGETEHPFTDHNNRNDVRITTHYFENDVAASMYSVIHEGGHALYELGIAPELDNTVCAGGCSTALHESQSRFYENIIGRSEAFCALVLPVMKEIFPEQMADVDEKQLYQAVNQAEPSLIRTEADELTYAMHVMIRYELEKALIAGSLQVEDLPGEWNRMYREYLGIEVPDDRSGCLQDCHWSGGLIGYFPSYALGSAYGVQMLESMKKTMDPYAAVANGELGRITEWLGEKVHRHGRMMTPDRIMLNACGAPFDPSFYVSYLTKKYSALYRLG